MDPPSGFPGGAVDEGDHHGSRGSSSRAKRLDATSKMSLARSSSGSVGLDVTMTRRHPERRRWGATLDRQRTS
jgi:hypothetical protein